MMAEEDVARLRAAWLRAEKALLAEHRVLATFEGAQTSPAASEPIPHQEGSPKYHGYRVAIPEGWTAIAPVFYPVPDVPDEPARQGMPAALLAGWKQFRAGVLLCRPGTDGRAALQEFEDDALLEAAFLGQDGQYLQASPVRPTYAVIPLAAPSSTPLDQNRSVECLILLPLFPALPRGQRESLPPAMMFTNGVCVYRSDSLGALK